VTRTARTRAEPAAPPSGHRRGLLLIGVAIVLTGLNLRTAVNSIGPVLEELEAGLGLSSGLAGLVTSLPVLCFAALGFAGPPLSARYRDSHILAGAMLAMAAGMALRAVAGPFWLFVAGTVVAMTGGALGNVLLPSLVKRHFPHRTGLLVGAYSTAMALGAAIASVSTAPIAAAAGADGWRWGLGVWAAFALLAALPWLAVPAAPGASRTAHGSIRTRALLRSPTAVAMTVFFGVQGIQAYVVVGWSAQYLRDSGLGAADAGLLLGLNAIVAVPLTAVIPALTVRPRLQRPLLLGFVACYAVGWTGMALAPLTFTWLWMVLLALGMGAFAMCLTLLGLRARTAETTVALSTSVQGCGYLLTGGGPLLVGVLRGHTGGYTGMFVVIALALLALLVSGWVATRPRFVDDEVPGCSGPVRSEDVVEVAGTELPVTVHPASRDVPGITPRDGGSPFG
jgi:CP family cyanate transporter-like MFS transporter